MTYVYFCDKIVENLLKISICNCKGRKNMKFRSVRKLMSSIKWKFYKLDVALMRKKLEQSDFFEGVSFTGDIIKEEIQKGVARWMFDLKKYKQI